VIDGSIARLFSSYPSIRVQTQGVQQQEISRVGETSITVCCLGGTGNESNVVIVKIPSSFGWGGQTQATDRSILTPSSSRISCRI